MQPDVREERKGPRVGSPQAAIDGFLKSAGLSSLEQCEQRDTGKGVFHFAVVEKKGGPALDVVETLVWRLVQQFPWPKAMRHWDDNFLWVRPLQSVLVVFDGAASTFSFRRNATYLPGTKQPQPDRTIEFGAKTRGHRFMAPGDFEVGSFAEYQRKLREAKIILDPAERRDIIRQQCEAMASGLGLSVKRDEALLDEVTGLVEWPVVLAGGIDKEFMDLPPEILTTTMRVNQKYFSLLNRNGQLAPKFLVVANIEAADKGRAIVAGNERVLRARLADARFFWVEDQKTSLEQFAVGLSDVTFHAKLGSIAEKVARVRALGEYLAGIVPGCDAGQTTLAADLMKADLLTGMVGEFPELQGVIGRYYALAEGKPEPVADAIADHYRPLGPADECPRRPVSVALALADRIDTLAGFFAIDEKPTGSKDPFALRRAALGLIRLVLENGLDLPLRPVFGVALGLHGDLAGAPHRRDAIVSALLEFLADRLKVALREKGTRHDLVAAVFAKNLDNLGRIVARAKMLQDFIGTEAGANLLTAYRRAANIVRIETAKDRNTAGGESLIQDRAVDIGSLVQSEEKALAAGLQVAKSWFKEHNIDDDLEATTSVMFALSGPIGPFFDNVTVNCGDPKLRANRLRLLDETASTIDMVADFSRIEA